MSGSYCGIRLWFYLLTGLAAVLFLVTQLMAMGSPSRGLSLEDCDWFRPSGGLSKPLPNVWTST